MERLSNLALSQLRAGQKLHGQHGIYSLLKPVSLRQNNAWLALDSAEKLVVVKTPSPTQLNNERRALKLCHGHASFRQLVDEIQDPPSLVLQHFDANLWYTLKLRRLHKTEVKRAAKAVLEGLVLLHELGYAHTDIKPRNVLANNVGENACSTDFRLGDLGDCVPVTVESNNGSHIIGSPMFRAPEVILNIPWTTAADVWSFGATIFSLLKKWHLFQPPIIKPYDKDFPIHVVVRQNMFFGPFPGSYFDMANEKAIKDLMVIVESGKEIVPFSTMPSEFIARRDRDFLCSFMKLDPRDRPLAKEILQHPWFDSVHERNYKVDLLGTPGMLHWHFGGSRIEKS